MSAARERAVAVNLATTAANTALQVPRSVTHSGQWCKLLLRKSGDPQLVQRLQDGTSFCINLDSAACICKAACPAVLEQEARIITIPQPLAD